MTNDLKQYMSTMGTGERSSDPLSYEEAHDAMDAILDGRFEPGTFGAFTVAERWKGQEPEELAGFLDALRSRDDGFPRPDRDDAIDIAGRFDGKGRSVNTDLASSLIVAAEGTAVFTHSGINVPTQQDTTILDIAGVLGWTTTPARSQVEKGLGESGFAYDNQSSYAPHLDELRDLRAQLGVRCFLNTIESMMNPTNARVHMGSFYHLPFAKRVIDTFDASRTMDMDRIYMVQGIEGQTEFRPGVSVLGIRDSDGFRDREIDTSALGLDFNRDRLEEIGSAPETSARLLRDLFKGEDPPEAYRKSVYLNTALKLLALGTVDDLDEGRQQAVDAVKSGRAQTQFDRVEEVFHSE